MTYDTRGWRTGAATQPAPAVAPPAQAPLWRSVAALAESLNAGATRPTFTPHGIRHYIRFAGTNGLARHIRRLGAKILIDEIGFRQWIDGHDSGPAR
jgi:hypothetical protein